MKRAFDADVIVNAVSAHQRWAVRVGVDDFLSCELVTPTLTSCRTGIGTRVPLRRERDLEEHQGSVRKVVRTTQTRLGYSRWSASECHNVGRVLFFNSCVLALGNHITYTHRCHLANLER